MKFACRKAETTVRDPRSVKWRRQSPWRPHKSVKPARFRCYRNLASEALFYTRYHYRRHLLHQTGADGLTCAACPTDPAGAATIAAGAAPVASGGRSVGQLATRTAP